MFDLIRKFTSRRELFRRGGMLAAASALFRGQAAAAGGLRIGPDIYQSIGVRPLINCRGTLTIISGSLELPEVRAAEPGPGGSLKFTRRIDHAD
jgi:L-seryl-tRNA(Ser) seleniumtransferase